MTPPTPPLCRCGNTAAKICALCKAPLCGWHTSSKTQMVPTGNGDMKLHRIAVCFPNCTSSFGHADDEEEPKVLRA